MKNKYKSVYCLPILLALFFLSSLHLTFAAEKYFIYPTGKLEISVPQIRIIGTAPGRDGHLTLLLKNSVATIKYPLQLNNEVFSQMISVPEGISIVELLDKDNTLDTLEINRLPSITSDKTDQDIWPYYLHSSSELTETCNNCHFETATTAKDFKDAFQKTTCITSKCHPGFDTGTYLHGPFQDGSCLECHNPHGTENPNFLVHNKTKLCFTCHEDAEVMLNAEGKIGHFPVQKGECLLCHEAHKSELEFHLKTDSVQNLCARCHGTTVTDHEVLHEPVESGDCNACHAAHISDHKGLLYTGGEDLCLTCHEVRKDEFQSKYIHEPVKKDCNICHDPHGSSADFHLKTKKDENGKYTKPDHPMEELCLSCHRKTDPNVTDQIENGKVQHKPVAEGKCTICHTPHSTNHSKQLNAPLKKICFSCHKKIKETIEGSLFKHGPILTNDCAQCHNVHGANHRALLRDNFSAKYYAAFKLENYQLCFNCHNAKIALDKTSLDTGFRNGTENLHYVHVNNPKKGRNCSTCHDIHASNQEKHIRTEVPFKKRFTITLKFTNTETGGGCVVGCHKPKDYDQNNPVKN